MCNDNNSDRAHSPSQLFITYFSANLFCTYFSDAEKNSSISAADGIFAASGFRRESASGDFFLAVDDEDSISASESPQSSLDSRLQKNNNNYFSILYEKFKYSDKIKR